MTKAYIITLIGALMIATSAIVHLHGSSVSLARKPWDSSPMSTDETETAIHLTSLDEVLRMIEENHPDLDRMC